MTFSKTLLSLGLLGYSLSYASPSKAFVYSRNYDFSKDYIEITDSEPKTVFQAKKFGEMFPQFMRALESGAPSSVELRNKLTSTSKIASIEETMSIANEDIWTYDLKLLGFPEWGSIPQMDYIRISLTGAPSLDDNRSPYILESHIYDFSKHYEHSDGTLFEANQLGYILPQMLNALEEACSNSLKDKLRKSAKLLSLHVTHSGNVAEAWTYELHMLSYPGLGSIPQFETLKVQEEVLTGAGGEVLEVKRSCDLVKP